MDVGEKGFCFRTMETVTKSPIGAFAYRDITKYSEVTKSKLNFDKIYKNLEENKYSSIGEWYTDVKTCLLQILKVIGRTTPFGLVCDTMLQNFNEIMQSRAKALLEEDDFTKKHNFARLENRFEAALTDCPNSQAELQTKSTVHESTEKRIFTKTEKSPKFGTDEIMDIFGDLAKISTDEEAQKIFKTSVYYVRQSPPKKGVLSIDLSQVSPFFLSIIKNQLLSGYKNR